MALHPAKIAVDEPLERPFLKWAGNKFRIVSALQHALGKWPETSRLIEPFVGSGAVFMNTPYSRYILNDSNQDLIGLYQTLATHGTAFIQDCKTLFTPQNNTPEGYYSLRDAFNESSESYFRAMAFVYLNRHGFNGLCRYNSRAGFNVPFGRYTKPYFPEREMLAFYHKVQRVSVTWQHMDFLSVMAQARAGDVVYCDPPYVPLSSTANFTSYSAGGFSQDQQVQLAETAIALSQQGVIVVISNHDTSLTRHWYAPACQISLSVQRFISCKGDKREKASEVLALFVPPALQSSASQIALQLGA